MHRGRPGDNSVNRRRHHRVDTGLPGGSGGLCCLQRAAEGHRFEDHHIGCVDVKNSRNRRRRQRFIERDVDPAAAKLVVTVEVVRGQRLFDVGNIKRGERVDSLLGGWNSPRAVGVDTERDLVADSLADSTDAFDVGVKRSGTDLELQAL